MISAIGTTRDAPALHSNSRLGRNRLIEKNTLAYYGTEIITPVASFIEKVPESTVMKR